MGRTLPGLVLAAAIAAAAYLIADPLAHLLPIPAIVVALLIGIALNTLADRPAFRPGIDFCVRTLLRIAVALLGLRISIGDIVALRAPTVLLVVIGMSVTIAASFALARLLGLSKAFGALAGAATAVCGASATLATASALPDYKGKQADVALVVIAANVISTVAMLIYPPLCALLGLAPAATGIVLGASIHDVAQVVGAGYAVSEPVGATAVIVKLFRVFLLLPVVIAVGFLFRAPGKHSIASRTAVPLFAVAFFILLIANSVLSSTPGLLAQYAPVKAVLSEASTWGLLVAIAALGLSTSFASLAALGWRHMVTFLGATFVILLAAVGGVLLLN